MTPIKLAFAAFVAILSLFWWLAEPADFGALNGFLAWRNLLVQYTGVLGIGLMSAALLLAVRPAWLETPLGGLDKMYRLHKWLGIGALVVSLSHWLFANGPKWAVALGWLERRGRPPRPQLPEASLQQWLASQRGLAEGIGEWAFYAALLLMVLALLRYFPYRRFFQSHRLLAVAYLALVWHSLILVKIDYWATPLGVLLGLLLATGSVCALLVLGRRRIGGSRAVGTVVGLDAQATEGVLAVEVELAGGWPGHRPGQFAFVTFHADEGPHPFTIASAWDGSRRLRFLIKALGDYTRTLPQRLRVGDPVSLEGPYGRFDFAGEAPRQIWIGAGIGITPFLARLQALAGRGGGQPVDLFHCAAQLSPQNSARLSRDAERAGVRLHLFVEPRDGRLSVAELVRRVPDWRQAEIWFCGPAAFGRLLRDGLGALGLPAGRFHQELFELR